jgi:hypothetical protein
MEVMGALSGSASRYRKRYVTPEGTRYRVLCLCLALRGHLGHGLFHGGGVA